MGDLQYDVATIAEFDNHGNYLNEQKAGVTPPSIASDPDATSAVQGHAQTSQKSFTNAGQNCKNAANGGRQIQSTDQGSGQKISQLGQNNPFKNLINQTPQGDPTKNSLPGGMPKSGMQQVMQGVGTGLQTAGGLLSNNPLSQALGGGGAGGALTQLGGMMTSLSSGAMGGGSMTQASSSAAGEAMASSARSNNNGAIRAGSIPANEQEQAALEVMEAEKGTPYAWGGGSPTGPTQGQSDGGGPADQAGDTQKIGYDCSGWAQHVTYEAAGVTIPKYSGDQYAQGIPVAFPKIGDLVFPLNEFDANGVPQHVQVYAGKDADGYDIVSEAPYSGGVVQYSRMGDSEFRTFNPDADSEL